MKRNRSSFFNDNPMDYNPNMFNQNIPMNGPMNYPNYNVNDDVNTRLAKLERQVNRLEHRLSVLEQNNTNYTTDDMDNNLGNMYMV
jgi:hypothetical protein